MPQKPALIPKRKATGAGTKIYLKQNVLEATYDRLAWVFKEFGDNVVVRVSGGKDSTVLLHLALEVARAEGRLPLKVYWLDQEAEWASTVEIVREWMTLPGVEPHWLQVPFRIFNATSQTDHWLHAWDPAEEKKWIHPQDPMSFKENVYGTDRFAKLFGAHLQHTFGAEKACAIAGVRTEESPNRLKGLTSFATYKDVTWGSVEKATLEQRTGKRQHYSLYPIYDWSWTDIWKAIHEHGWAYNSLYDLQYRYGVHIQQMRVSNLHHETAVRSLFYLQEFEPDTYERMTARIGGIDTAGKLGAADYFPDELPFMFDSWGEYRDYLMVHLVEPKYRPRMAREMNEQDRKLPRHILEEQTWKVHVKCILTCDWEAVKLANYLESPLVWEAQKLNKPNWLTPEELPIPDYSSMT